MYAFQSVCFADKNILSAYKMVHEEWNYFVFNKCWMWQKIDHYYSVYFQVPCFNHSFCFGSINHIHTFMSVVFFAVKNINRIGSA